MAQKHTKEEWLAIIEEFENRDITQAEYIEEKDIKIATFRYWLYKQRKRNNGGDEKSTGVEFVEVLEGQSCRGEALRLHIDTVTLEFERLPPARWLSELISSKTTRTFVC